MDKPLLSVCLITYNQVDFIKEAIDGVLIQKTNFPIEIVIADDFSTDGTREILKSYKEKEPKLIKLILQKENVGAKNFLDLISYPQSKYVAYIEGDDYWTDPLKLQKQVDFLEANQDHVVCYHDAKTIDESGKTLEESYLSESLKRDYTQNELMFGHFTLSLSLCFRNVIKTIPEEFFHVYGGDIFLTSLLGEFGKGKYMGNIENAAYRQHGNSIWSSLPEQDKNRNVAQTRIWLYTYFCKKGLHDIAEYHLKKVESAFKKNAIHDDPCLKYAVEERNALIIRDIGENYLFYRFCFKYKRFIKPIVLFSQKIQQIVTRIIKKIFS